MSSILPITTGISAGANPTDVQEQEAEVADAEDRLEEFRAEAGAAYESYNNALSELNKLDEEITGTEEAGRERRGRRAGIT